jgi:hypothetical protein
LCVISKAGVSKKQSLELSKKKPTKWLLFVKRAANLFCYQVIK